MAEKKTTRSATREQGDSVRGAFLAAGRRLFAEKGFDGVSVKELAQATGYNAALVNYHFKNKEGLYRECVMPLMGVGLATMERTLRTPTSRQDFLTRFELFVEDFILSHLHHQDLCIILKRDSNTMVVRQLYREHFVQLHDHLRVFLKGAKKARIVRQDLDTEIAAQFVLSSVFQLVASDRMRAEVGQNCLLNKRSLAPTIRQVTACLLYGLVDCEE